MLCVNLVKNRNLTISPTLRSTLLQHAFMEKSYRKYGTHDSVKYGNQFEMITIYIGYMIHYYMISFVKMDVKTFVVEKIA